jgi:hypothetical protein
MWKNDSDLHEHRGGNNNNNNSSNDAQSYEDDLESVDYLSDSHTIDMQSQNNSTLASMEDDLDWDMHEDDIFFCDVCARKFLDGGTTACPLCRVEMTGIHSL